MTSVRQRARQTFSSAARRAADVDVAIEISILRGEGPAPGGLLRILRVWRSQSPTASMRSGPSLSLDSPSGGPVETPGALADERQLYGVAAFHDALMPAPLVSPAPWSPT
jgi:hypothetical protein